MPEAKGLPVDIFKHEGRDYSNGGISSRADQVTIIGIGVPLFAPTETAPAVVLKQKQLRRENGEAYTYTYAVPADRQNDWAMFGGTLLYTSDSRMPTSAPIKLHDRFE